MISLLHYFSHSANWVPSLSHDHIQRERNEWIDLKAIANVSFFSIINVQTSVINVDCTRKGTLFLSSTFAFSSFFWTMRCIFSITIVFNIRSHHLYMCIVYACVCLFNRRLSSLLFSFGRDLFFYDVIVVEYNNEQSMMRVKRKEKERKQNRYNPTTINDVKMTCIKLFFFFFSSFDFYQAHFLNTHTFIDWWRVE